MFCIILFFSCVFASHETYDGPMNQEWITVKLAAVGNVLDVACSSVVLFPGNAHNYRFLPHMHLKLSTKDCGSSFWTDEQSKITIHIQRDNYVVEQVIWMATHTTIMQQITTTPQPISDEQTTYQKPDNPGQNNLNSNEPKPDNPGQNRPDSNEQKPDKPGQNRPDSDRPGQNGPDSDEQKPDKPGQNRPDSDKPGQNNPNSNKPDSEEHKTDRPGQNNPNSNRPDSNDQKPDKPDSEEQKPDKPDSDEHRPGSDEQKSDKPNPSESGQNHQMNPPSEPDEKANNHNAKKHITGTFTGLVLFGVALIAIIVMLLIVEKRRQKALARKAPIDGEFLFDAPGQRCVVDNPPLHNTYQDDYRILGKLGKGANQAYEYNANV